MLAFQHIQEAFKMGFQVDMSPLERSSMRIGSSLMDIGNKVGGAIQRSGQQAQQQQEQGDIEALSRLAADGNVDALKELMIKSPPAARMAAEFLQSQQVGQQGERDQFDAEKLKQNQDTIRKLYRVQSLPEAERAAEYQNIIDNPMDDFDESDLPHMNSKMLEVAANQYGIDQNEIKAMFSGQDKKLEQGKGIMEGYSFDPTTGAYSINPALKTKLEDVKLKGPKLTLKDKISLNKEFTNLTKGTQGIYAAAASLSSLKDSSTATDKLAAIFKFMKSLDPTSVVREGEQDMAFRTGGAADTMVGYVNSLMGEGKLSETAFLNMVNTAKTLANSAIDTSTPEISSYLETFSDDLSPNFKKSLLNRMPKSFDIQEVAKKDDLSKLSLEELKALREKG